MAKYDDDDDDDDDILHGSGENMTDQGSLVKCSKKYNVEVIYKNEYRLFIQATASVRVCRTMRWSFEITMGMRHGV